MRDLSARPVPIIAVAGSVGKTTVAVLLDGLLRAAGRRTVTWLDTGVTIDGQLQAGELQPWSRGMRLVLDGELDLAIQELPQATVRTVGLPRGAYQTAIITSMALGDRAFAASAAAADQAAANRVVAASVHAEGALVLNADDPDVADLAGTITATIVLWALSASNPILRRHLRAGGVGVYADDDRVVLSQRGAAEALIEVARTPVTIGGQAAFQTSNLLGAIGGAVAAGLTTAELRRALPRLGATEQFIDRVVRLEHGAQCRVLIAGAPSLPALHAVARFMRRVTSGGAPVLVALALSRAWSAAEAERWGRLLARFAHVLFVAGPEAGLVADAASAVVTTTRPPTIAMTAASEVEAVARLLKMASSGDTLLVLTGAIAETLALVESYEARPMTPGRSSP